MNVYAKTITLSFSLSLLCGCQQYLAHQNSSYVSTIDPTPEIIHTLPVQAPQSYISSVSYLQPLKEDCSHIDVSAIQLAFVDHHETLSYVLQRCISESIPADVAMIPFLLTNYEPDFDQDGNAGLWKISPGFAQNLSLTNNYWFDGRRDIIQSTDAMIDYVKFLYTELNNDWSLVIAAMHTGLQPVMDAVLENQAAQLPISLEHLNLPSDTHEFIQHIKAVSFHLENQLETPEEELVEVQFPGQIDIESLAHTAAIPSELLNELNAGFKRPLTDPNGPHRILVSKEQQKQLLSIAKSPTQLREVSKSNWNQHIVKKNESLGVIANDFDTSVSEIKRVNHLSSDIIHINQKLIIPERTHTHASNIKLEKGITPGPKRIVHTVEKNQTLFHLASQYNVSVDKISSWNQLTNQNIKPGQILKIWQYTPHASSKFYTVKANDSLAKIARNHNVSIKALKESNHLNSNVIHPNDRLIIPKH